MRALIGKRNGAGLPVSVPASKSLTHRAVIMAALADGTSVIESPAANNDIGATIMAVRKLGAKVVIKDDTFVITGIKEPVQGPLTIECGESATTLRFLIPLLAMRNEECFFACQGRLVHRPLNIYEKIFRDQELLFERNEEGVRIRGPLHGGDFVIGGHVSSQFISGLMLTLPLMKADSSITVREPFESASYVKLTEECMKENKIAMKRNGLVIRIQGRQQYRAFRKKIEGDASHAACFAVLGMISQYPVTIRNIPEHSAQGDRIVFELIKRFGGKLQKSEDGYIVSGGDLHGCTVDLADCPDLAPALFVLASQCEGETVFRNVRRLRYKESDRIASMEQEMKKLGCQIFSDADHVYIQGKTKIRGGIELDGHHDHRVVMALGILSAIAEENVMIDGADAVNKSYPGFFADLKCAGADIRLTESTGGKDYGSEEIQG